jgi:site-specific recombinase XerC
LTSRAARTSPDTWGVYQTLFEDHLESINRAPLTIRTYAVALTQFVDFVRAEAFAIGPSEVARPHLVSWMLYLQRPPEKGGRGLSAQTALQRFRSLSRFFAWLVEIGEATSSPMEKMKAPKVPEQPVPVVSTGDLQQLLKACSGKSFAARRDKAILSLFIDVGMRAGEMAALNLDDLDIKERRLQVFGKGRKTRPVKIVKETRTDVQMYLLKRNGHPRADDRALWLGKKGRLSASGIRQMVRRRCEEAGIPPIHPHQLRHTFAHEYLSRGGNEGDLMRITGWTSRQMLDRYGASVATQRALEAHDRFSPRSQL